MYPSLTPSLIAAGASPSEKLPAKFELVRNPDYSCLIDESPSNVYNLIADNLRAGLDGSQTLRERARLVKTRGLPYARLDQRIRIC